MKYAFRIVGLITMSFVLGCKSPKDKIRHNIKVLEENPISIPYNQMMCWTNDSLKNDSPNEQAKLKLVVYMDSSQCTECEIKTMHLWDDFVKLEKKYDGRFKVVFIVQASKKSPARVIASAFKHFKVEYTMYIDSTNIFSSVNPHIPAEKMYHVFLLDENDNVRLVGNPQFNPDIENLLLNFLEQKL